MTAIKRNIKYSYVNNKLVRIFDREWKEVEPEPIKNAPFDKAKIYNNGIRILKSDCCKTCGNPYNYHNYRHPFVGNYESYTKDEIDFRYELYFPKAVNGYRTLELAKHHSEDIHFNMVVMSYFGIDEIRPIEYFYHKGILNLGVFLSNKYNLLYK